MMIISSVSLWGVLGYFIKNILVKENGNSGTLVGILHDCLCFSYASAHITTTKLKGKAFQDVPWAGHMQSCEVGQAGGDIPISPSPLLLSSSPLARSMFIALSCHPSTAMTFATESTGQGPLPRPFILLHPLPVSGNICSSHPPSLTGNWWAPPC